MAHTAADIYLEDMKTLIDDNWIEYYDTPKPDIFIVNDSTILDNRFNLNDKDVIIVSADGVEQIKYRGNIQYYDRIVPISLDFRTKVDRQRLHELYKMIRILLFSQKWSFPNYQLIKMTSYQEMVEEEKLIWRGILKLNLENNAIAVDT